MPGARPLKRSLARLFLPRNRGGAEPTLVGSVLVALCLAVGMAAYNSANNLLFIVLALLLASLLLGGVLSWLNFRGAEFELHTGNAARAGEPVLVVLVVRNTKRSFPLQSLWFELSAVPPSGRDLEPVRFRLWLGPALEPGEERRLSWEWTPSQRGRWILNLEAAGSPYPFGFLRKRARIELREETLVRPGRVALSRFLRTTLLAQRLGERRGRSRGGDDLLSLRDYRAGDSHRLVHWKASARHRRLLVRRFSSASEAACSLLVSTDARLWLTEEGFERGLALAATLAERCYEEGWLQALALDDRCLAPVRCRGDLDGWLDLLTEAERRPGRPPLPEGLPGPLRIEPQGPAGAVAHDEGRTIASA